jgi:hypothetical protein
MGHREHIRLRVLHSWYHYKEKNGSPGTHLHFLLSWYHYKDLDDTIITTHWKTTKQGHNW